MSEAAGAYSNSGSPELMEYTVTPAQTFVQGAVLVFASGLVSEAGANPALIVGVACANAFSNPGYDAANSPSVFTWREGLISVYRAVNKNIFVSPVCNNTLTSAKYTPVAADVGAQYGIVKQTSGASSGCWWPDVNLTTTDARIEVVKIDIAAKLFHWKFLHEYTYNE